MLESKRDNNGRAGEDNQQAQEKSGTAPRNGISQGQNVGCH
jgi:hypothetical protein